MDVGRSEMRRVAFLAVIVAGSLLVTSCDSRNGGAGTKTDTLREGDRAPNFVLPAANGPEVSLEEFRGRKAALLYFSMGPG